MSLAVRLPAVSVPRVLDSHAASTGTVTPCITACASSYETRGRRIQVRHIESVTLPDAKRVHAENGAGEFVGHVAVHAFHHRHHGDEEHHADEDANDGEAALELLRADCLEREPNGVEKGHRYS